MKASTQCRGFTVIVLAGVPTPAAPTQSQPVAPAVPESLATAEPPAQGSVASETSESVDVNTASLEQLNGLGAGMIGRAVIANRPYASPHELVAKRVLSHRDCDTMQAARDRALSDRGRRRFWCIVSRLRDQTGCACEANG